MSVVNAMPIMNLEVYLMNKVSLMVWGRPLELEIVYDCYSDEEILDNQVISYDEFMKNAVKLLDDVLPTVKKYCLQLNKSEIGEEHISNIFKYVVPQKIFIKRTDVTVRKVAILCAYRFNPDDGIAIVFQNEKFYDISSNNIIL